MKTHRFRIVLMLCGVSGILFNVCGVSADSASPPDKEIEDAHASLGKAYGRYISSLKQSDGTPQKAAALSAQIIGPAKTRMTDLLRSRTVQFDKQIYGKVYHANGTVSELAEGGNATQASREKSADSPSSASERAPAKAPAGNKVTIIQSSSGASGNSRPEFVLDGNQVPKELEYPGKTSP